MLVLPIPHNPFFLYNGKSYDRRMLAPILSKFSERWVREEMDTLGMVPTDFERYPELTAALEAAEPKY